MLEIGKFYPLDADIIIIGAGVSGMTAAYTLIAADPSLNITILEATDRIGGRTLTDPLLNYRHYDLGGQWISSQQELLLNLLNHLEIYTIDKIHTRRKMIIEYKGKIFKKYKSNALDFCGILGKFQLALFGMKMEILCKKSSLDEDIASLNMEQFINDNVSSSAVKALLKSIVLYHCGLKAVFVTLKFYVFFCISTYGFANQLLNATNGLYEMWIENGAQEICNRIAEYITEDEVIISTNVKVTEINKGKLQIEVKTTDQTYYTTNVIVAIPPSAILKINFFPPLPPAKIDALRNATPGELSKFVAIYQEAFWTKANLSGEIYVVDGYNQTRPLLRCFSVTVNNRPALTGFTLTIPNKTDLRSRILEQLSQYFGNLALTPIEFFTMEWTTGSPMTCYDSLIDLIEINKSDTRIYWAGAESSLEWFGTIAGAACSGYRAAMEVLYDLRPGSLTVSVLNVFSGSFHKIRSRYRTTNSVYEKMLNPYYQIILCGILVILLRIMWRKRIFSYIYHPIRNIITKIY